jgi:hypothetical protein
LACSRHRDSPGSERWYGTAGFRMLSMHMRRLGIGVLFVVDGAPLRPPRTVGFSVAAATPRTQEVLRGLVGREVLYRDPAAAFRAAFVRRSRWEPRRAVAGHTGIVRWGERIRDGFFRGAAQQPCGSWTSSVGTPPPPRCWRRGELFLCRRAPLAAGAVLVVESMRPRPPPHPPTNTSPSTGGQTTARRSGDGSNSQPVRAHEPSPKAERPEREHPLKGVVFRSRGERSRVFSWAFSC